MWRDVVVAWGLGTPLAPFCSSPYNLVQRGESVKWPYPMS
jgi:hypothetical protein